MRLETRVIIEKYKDNLFRAAFNVCRNAADADDVVQETFLQYHSIKTEFESETHIRAWLFRVAINKAKNVNLSFWRRKAIPFGEYIDSLPFESSDSQKIFAEAMRLPEKYRIVIHLFYYEEYSVREISEILGLRENNVKVRLNRGRKLLKKALQEEWENDE